MKIMSLGENLRLLRKKKNWTQQELATKTGIKLAHISTLETKNADPKLSTIYKLMEALGATANELLMDASKEEGNLWFKGLMEQARRLPAKDLSALAEIIKKFIFADNVRLASYTSLPDEVIGEMLEHEHKDEYGDPDQKEIQKDAERVRKYRDEEEHARNQAEFGE
jgi:transcriptional regulator with XRE-family HTH domain